MLYQLKHNGKNGYNNFFLDVNLTVILDVQKLTIFQFRLKNLVRHLHYLVLQL